LVGPNLWKGPTKVAKPPVRKRVKKNDIYSVALKEEKRACGKKPH